MEKKSVTSIIDYHRLIFIHIFINELDSDTFFVGHLIITKHNIKFLFNCC